MVAGPTPRTGSLFQTVQGLIGTFYRGDPLLLSRHILLSTVLKIFNMQNEKPVSTPFSSHFKLSKEMFPKTQEEMEYMSEVPYASIVGSLMYAMVCIRLDISHAVGVVSRYMNNPGKEH